MKVQRIKIAANHYIWLVIDHNYLPIQPIESFIRFLHATEKSSETLKSYAMHLKLFWQFLHDREINWQEVAIPVFAEFVHWLRSQAANVICLTHATDVRRTERTVNAILSAISSFYRYHNQSGNTCVLFSEPHYLPQNRHRSLLHHVFKSKPTWKRIVGLKVPKTMPKTITKEQIKILLTACRNVRDQFLLSLLYDTGLRIGQALALKHCDIKSWDNEILVIYRKNNVNQMNNKTRSPNVLHVSQDLMRQYATYLNTYLVSADEQEYVFVNNINNEPLSYGATRKIFKRLTKNTGIFITPHMLRHTHATELTRHGWDAVLVQKRLGHAHVETTINTYTHINNQDLKIAFQRYQTKIKGNPNESN
jgi:integrase/recombinase XerD